MEDDCFVLIIADDPPRADALVAMLSGFGARLEVAIGGSAGILVAMTNAPDAAVIDTGTADIDGWRVAETLRIQLETREMALVGVTWGIETDPNPDRAPVFDREVSADAADGIVQALREALQRRDIKMAAGGSQDVAVLPVTMPVQVKKGPALVKVARKRVDADAIVTLPAALPSPATGTYFAKWPGTAWFAILPSMVPTIRAAGAQVLTSEEMSAVAKTG